MWQGFRKTQFWNKDKLKQTYDLKQISERPLAYWNMAQSTETKLLANRTSRKQAPRRIWIDYLDGEEDAWNELKEDSCGGADEKPIRRRHHKKMAHQQKADEHDNAGEAAIKDEVNPNGNKPPGKKEDPNGRTKENTPAMSGKPRKKLETRLQLAEEDRQKVDTRRKKKSRSRQQRRSSQKVDEAERFPQVADDNIPDWFR